MPSLRRPDDLGLARVGGQFAGNQPRPFGRRGAAGKIEQAHRQARHLVDQDARQPPKGGADRRVLGAFRGRLLRV